MAEDNIYKRSLEETPTWAFAVVCFVLLATSIIIEHVIHSIGKWFKKKRKSALYESLEKVKGELMMLGFLSMLLTVFQGPLSKICISKYAASTWHPCSNPNAISNSNATSATIHRKLLQYLDPMPRRTLAAKGYDKCADQMRRWKKWEDETKTIEYEFYCDPERFRLPKDTTFGQRSASSDNSLDLLRKLTILHCGMDLLWYIKRSLDEDFKVVIGISPIIWFFAALFLLTNTHGWYSYYWLPFIPLVTILMVGAKLQMIITKMGLMIEDRGKVVKGALVVELEDDLFWFNRPRLLLFIIHLVFFHAISLFIFLKLSYI